MTLSQWAIVAFIAEMAGLTLLLVEGFRVRNAAIRHRRKIGALIKGYVDNRDSTDGTDTDLVANLMEATDARAAAYESSDGAMTPELIKTSIDMHDAFDGHVQWQLLIGAKHRQTHFGLISELSDFDVASSVDIRVLAAGTVCLVAGLSITFWTAFQALQGSPCCP